MDKIQNSLNWFEVPAVKQIRWMKLLKSQEASILEFENGIVEIREIEELKI